MDIEEFQVEDVEAIAKRTVQAALIQVQYDQDRVTAWTNSIIDTCLKDLQAMGKPFKYIVTCIITQKNGAGLHTAAGAFWDSRKDGFVKVPWENATLHCIVAIYGLAMTPSSLENGY